MRRLLIGIVVTGIVLSVGVCSAQQSGPPMPEKVRAFLDKMTGTWEVRAGEETGRIGYRWNAGRSAVIGDASYDKGEISGFGTEMFHWDGTSHDGIVVSMSYAGDEGLYHAQIHGTVLSESRMTGRRTAVAAGKKAACDVQLTFEGPDRFVWKDTNGVLGEEAQPDIAAVHNRIKASSDEQELLRLQDVWCRAEVEKDAAALRRILADDFVIVTSEGDIITRDQMMRSGEHILTSLMARDLKVQLYGDTALLKGVAQWSEPGGKSTQIVFTDTWLKRDGRWQCIISHESGQRQIVDSAKLRPEMKKLEVFVGDWTYEGEQMEPPVEGLPFGEAGPFSGKSTLRFVLDGAFQESRFKDDAPGTARGFGLFGYDSKEKCYVWHGYVADGSQSTSTVTLQGHTLRKDSVTTTSKGDRVPVRYIEEYSSDWSSYTSTVEASPDNGKTWKLWWKERGKKVNP